MTEPEATAAAASTAWLARAGLPVQSAQGLDVSNFQGRYDWQAARARIPHLRFGIHRLTQGLGTPGTNSPDPTAVWNHAQIKAIGVLRGAYHFLDPFEDGARQAAYFVAQYERLGLTAQDMLWLDTEADRNPGPAATAACGRAFMAELRTLVPHNPVGAYTFISYATTGHCAGLGMWPLWLARPGRAAPAPPPPWAKWMFWQWGTRNGTDADAFDGTDAALDAWVASYAPKPPPPPAADGWHAADGRTSLAALARAQPGDVSVQQLVHRTAAHTPAGFGPAQAPYISRGNWDTVMPPGMLIRVAK